MELFELGGFYHFRSGIGSSEGVPGSLLKDKYQVVELL